MITVKIRDIWNVDATLVGQMPFSEVDSFVGRLKQDGVQSVDDREYTINTQWVLDEDAKEFYLEVIMGEEE